MKEIIPIVCLMGPTASGKTQLAVQLVQQFPFEIISVDSAMVYREMNIGTAKPTADILKIAPHRLIDIRDPKEIYSTAQFCEDAWQAIADIAAQGKIPLLVGGTMMYFRSLQQGLSILPRADIHIRENISNEAKKMGWAALHEQLKKIDVHAAERIHPNDSQRIQRALEVYQLTGKNLTTWQQEGKLSHAYQVYNIAIAPSERAVLHERIAKRFTEMLRLGFVDEVKKLYERGDLSLDLPSIRSVGYRQIWEYFLGKYTFDEMCERGIIATRQVAKRQLTWLRHWKDEVKWFESEDEKLFSKVVSHLTELNNTDLVI